MNQKTQDYHALKLKVMIKLKIIFQIIYQNYLKKKY